LIFVVFWALFAVWKLEKLAINYFGKMKKSIQLVPSGITIADNAWGGFYRGGTYLLIGPRKSGRTLLSLQFAMECAKQKEICLYFTNMRPKDLMIQAASIDFDLQHYMNQNLIIVVKVAPPAELAEYQNSDELLIEYLKDIVTVVEQYQPSKIVFDELTPFIGFQNLFLLQEIFLETTEKIEDSGITSLFVVGEPAVPSSKMIIDSINLSATGVIHLQKKSDMYDRTKGGTITISPNIGHTEGKFKANYFIEAYKGVTTDFQPIKRKTLTGEKIISFENDKYKSLSEIDIPPADYSLSNFYTIDDFSLIINNQIAFYKSTGQTFRLLSIKISSELQRTALLTHNQLQNAIRLAIDKKDKICVIGNKILVLITKDDQKSLTNFVARVKHNLPVIDEDQLFEIMSGIFIYTVKVNENTVNADDLLNEIISEEKFNRSSFD
jgi:circadian clock protein KaiC